MNTKPLHIIICNERLLPRFGVDRLLLLLGRGLRDSGHRVTYVCLRCERDVVESVSSAIHVLPELAGFDLWRADQSAANWLKTEWAGLNTNDDPALVISGGWPFFSVSQVCAELNVPSIFIDAGAVPHDGMSAEAAHIQRELRRLRASTISKFTQVLPISDFISRTQTLPERGTADGVETVLLGADHLDSPMFPPQSGGTSDEQAISAIDDMIKAGCKPILLLGRYEKNGYKNSPACFELLTKILSNEPNARLLLLARREEAGIPSKLHHAVYALGHISDAALDMIMARCSLGLSVSLWEGFNLPLAEMQWRNRPVLAFSLGAHPEVTADPWFLCGSTGEMADKAVSLLRDGLPLHVVAEDRFGTFRERFRWNDAIARYRDIIEHLAIRQLKTGSDARSPSRLIFIDVSNAAIDPANPGVIRVVRRTCQALQHDPALTLIFVKWVAHGESYRLLTEPEQKCLRTYDGPRDGFSLFLNAAGPQGSLLVQDILSQWPADKQPVLFLPEVILDGRFPERLVWASANGLRVAALLYDLIPVTHMPFCAADVVRAFGEYLEALVCVDALWAISGESLRQFELYADKHRLPLPSERRAVWLPGQFAAEPRPSLPLGTPRDDGGFLILSVGSIEPRKNHLSLVEAFRALMARRPDLPARLVLAGNRFGGADSTTAWLEQVVREDPLVSWTGLIPDLELGDLYRAADFSVYPSLVEGFGLPVMESLWMGCPCLCHSDGVMAELAAGGGCLTTDMTDTKAIEFALERLLDDAGLRQKLKQEAAAREINDWRSYAGTIGARLQCV